MFELERLAIAFIGSVIAALWDLKTTDIPDVLVAGMVIVALAFGAGEGISTGDYTALTLSVGTGLIFLAIGLIMYFSGQWGGGDGGLLVGIGMLMSYLNQDYISFPVAYLSNIVIVGVGWSIVYASYIISGNRSLFAALRKEFGKTLLSFGMLLIIVGLGLSSLLFFYFYPRIVAIPIIIIILYILYRLAKIVDASFFRKISSKDLKVGDMIGEDIPRLKIGKKLIRGLTAAEVKRIQKMKKTVLIREGI
ncbi:MAG TPA: prepilin peptidase, partial [archaeon]|nr:prepilin peptidase [archaeon]